MKEEDKTTLALFVAYVAGLVAVIVLSVIFATQLQKKHEEIAELQDQILQYQRASRPALEARGWDRWLFDGERSITPEFLKYSLNPCYTTLRGNWDSDCGPKMERNIPITIERRR